MDSIVTRLLIYLLLFGTVLYLLSALGRRQGEGGGNKTGVLKSSRWFRSKVSPREIWVQIYESPSLDEARVLQARLQEEEIECVLYEQGRKDIHGNELPGIGIAVPRTAVPHAQRIISRMPS